MSEHFAKLEVPLKDGWYSLPDNPDSLGGLWDYKEDGGCSWVVWAYIKNKRIIYAAGWGRHDYGPHGPPNGDVGFLFGWSRSLDGRLYELLKQKHFPDFCDDEWENDLIIG